MRLGGVPEVQLDLRSDMAGLVLCGRTSEVASFTYHTEIGHAADYVGRQARDRATRRPCTHVHHNCTFRLSTIKS